MHERLQVEPALIPKIDLMKPVQIEGYLAWHDLIGDRKKVLYNAMGPDVSTVLLTTNAEKIIAVDENHFSANNLTKELESFRYLKWGVREVRKRLDLDLEHRKANGYWDYAVIGRWGTPRLLAMELKYLGVKKNSIFVSEESNSRFSRINFNWAYPGEKVKSRELIYLRGKLDELLASGKQKYINNLDAFYQKGLPEDYLTHDYLPLVLPKLKKKSVVAIGYKMWGGNKNYGENIWDGLGPTFAELRLNPKLESKIDKLPDDWDRSEGIKYGMKLHVFSRG